MTARRNKSVCRVIGAAKGTVREHIAVEVIAYRIAVEGYKPVISIICKTTAGRISYVTRCVVGK